MTAYLQRSTITPSRPERCLPVAFLFAALGMLLLAAGCGRSPKTQVLVDEVFNRPVEIRMGDPAMRSREAVLFDLRQEVNRLRPLFDPYSARSELSTINQTAGLSRVPISYDTYRLLQHLVRFSRLSGGRFDITTSPVSQLWGFEGGLAPSAPLNPGILTAALRGVGFDKIRLSERSIRLNTAFTKIDVFDLLPAYALDLTILEERKLEVSNLFIRFGDTVRVLGRDAEGRYWTCPIQDPESGVLLGSVEFNSLPAACLLPLSEETIRIAGQQYRNQIDPRTGFPVEHIRLAVTLTKSATKARALSEALLVAEKEHMMSVVERFQDAAALVVPNREPLEIWISEGAESLFRILPEHQSAVSILRHPAPEASPDPQAAGNNGSS